MCETLKRLWVQVKNGKSGFTFGRIVLIANGWALNIDQVNKLNIDTVNQVGGYGITHAARLERVNGDVFATEDADSILKNIFIFFRLHGDCGPHLFN